MFRKIAPLVLWTAFSGATVVWGEGLIAKGDKAPEVPAAASVGDKYSRLLRIVSVPKDEASYGKFNDFGRYQATDYGAERNIPAGYWVYVATKWYVWEAEKENAQFAQVVVAAAPIVIAPRFDAPPAPADAPQLDGLPADAQKLVVAFDKEATEIRLKAKRDIEARQEKLIQQLAKLQDAYSKPGTLDEAVAIRDRIRQLKSDLRAGAVDAKPDPGMMTGFRGQLGKVFHFRVTGNAAGFVFGTDVYTDDSSLATAAVHAGVLRDGQQGIVKVTIHPGQPVYPGTSRNGVTSYSWQDHPGSYRVEAP